MWQIIAAVALLYFMTVKIWSWHTFDKLVRWEYENYRTMWEKDGRPNGYFWRAPENRKAMQIHLNDRWLLNWWFNWTFRQVPDKWLLSTPMWMRGDAEALRLLHRFRLLSYLWFVSLIAPIIAATIVFVFR